MVNIKTYISIVLLFFIFISFSNYAYSAQNNNIKVEQKEYESKNVKELFKSFYRSTGVYEFLNPVEGKLGPEKLKPMSKLNTGLLLKEQLVLEKQVLFNYLHSIYQPHCPNTKFTSSRNNLTKINF